MFRPLFAFVLEVIKKIKSYHIVLAILEFFILWNYVLPFVQHNNLYIWDMVGHYYLADYYKEVLWPRFTGWNPHFFGGFPQGYFYPSLFHWIVGGIGKLIGTFWAFKLITTIVLLAPPFAFLYFLRKAGFGEHEASLGTLAMFAALVYIGSFAETFPGGDYAATFNFGLVPQAASGPLLFLALGAYLGSLKEGKVVLPALLLAALALTHFYSFVIAAFAAIALTVSEVVLNPKKLASVTTTAATTGLLSFALVAFWLIPLALHREFASFAGFMGVPARPAFLFNAVIVAVILMILFRHDGALRLFSASIPQLALFLVQDKILVFIPLQMWRFALYPILFLSGTIGIIVGVTKIKAIKKAIPKIKEEHLRLLTTMFIILITLLVLYYAKKYDRAWPVGTFGMNFTLPKLDGRILTIPIHGTGLNPMSHIAQHLVAWGGNEEINGLFIESTPNVGYVTHIKREIDERVGVWGTFPAEVTPNKNELLPYHFKYFGINYVLTNLDPEYFRHIFGQAFSRSINTNSIFGYYNLIKVADNKLIEVLNYVPSKTDNFAGSQWNWFFDSDRIRQLISEEHINCSAGTGSEKIKVMQKSQEHIKFYVESPNTVPIHIKIPYHPNWKAYVNGKETKIYKVPINMMLVCGKDEIELRYIPTQIEIVSYSITVLGIVAIAFLIWVN